MPRNEPSPLSNRRALPALFALAVAVAVAVGIGLLADDRSPSPEDGKGGARTTCSIDPADGEVAITASIEGCPDGSVVRFPPNRQYNQANRILVKDRRNLVIDGNGSTFTTSFKGRANKINGNWLVLRGYEITLMNMTSVGTFAYTGERSLARISPDPDFSEANPNYGLYGVDTVHLKNLKAYGAWGDGVTTGPDEYEDGSSPDYTRNVFISNMQVEKVARMCWGPTSGINIWIRDSSCKDAWYGGLDAEIDNPEQPLQGLHIIGNRFEGVNHLGIFVPVAAANVATRDIEIRDNQFVTPNDQQCTASVHVGGYPDSNPSMFRNVVVIGNSVMHYGAGIVLDHVEHGLIEGNTLIRLQRDGFTPVGLCGPGAADPIRVTNSVDVTVEANTIGP